MSEAQRMQNEMNGLVEIYRLKGELLELRDERDRLRANLVNCVARLEAYYGEDYPAVRDAKAALTPAGQRWTRSKPTVQGWYWYRGKQGNGGVMVRVDKGFMMYRATFFLTNSQVGHAVDELPGEWQGPIVPNEATE